MISDGLNWFSRLLICLCCVNQLFLISFNWSHVSIELIKLLQVVLFLSFNWSRHLFSWNFWLIFLNHGSLIFILDIFLMSNLIKLTSFHHINTVHFIFKLVLFSLNLFIKGLFLSCFNDFVIFRIQLFDQLILLIYNLFINLCFIIFNSWVKLLIILFYSLIKCCHILKLKFEMRNLIFVQNIFFGSN